MGNEQLLEGIEERRWQPREDKDGLRGFSVLPFPLIKFSISPTHAPFLTTVRRWFTWFSVKTIHCPSTLPPLTLLGNLVGAYLDGSALEPHSSLFSWNQQVRYFGVSRFKEEWKLEHVTTMWIRVRVTQNTPYVLFSRHGFLDGMPITPNMWCWDTLHRVDV